MKHVWRKLFSLRFLALFLVVGTIVWTIYHPQCVLKNCRLFDVEVFRTSQSGMCMAFMPWVEQPTVMLCQHTNYDTRFFAYNLKRGSKPELSLSDMLADPDLLADESDRKVYTVLRNVATNSWRFVAISFEEPHQLTYHSSHIFTDSLLISLKDTSLVVRGETFLHHRVVDQDSLLQIEELTDGLRVVIGDSLLSPRMLMHPQKINEDHVLEDIAELLRRKTGKPFDTRDVYRIFTTYLSRDLFQVSYSSEKGTEHMMFSPRFWGRWDINGDGIREFFILFSGGHYISSRLVCYDPAAEKMLWMRSFASAPVCIFAEDVDGDGEVEIGVGTHAPSGHESPDFFISDQIGERVLSDFTLLDCNGNIEVRNGRDMHYQFGRFRTDVLTVPAPENRAVYIAKMIQFEHGAKNLLLLHTDTGLLDTLDVQYHGCSGFWREGDNIFLWESEGGHVRLRTFDQDLNEFNCLTTDLPYEAKVGSARNRIQTNSFNGYNVQSEHLLDSKLRMIYDTWGFRLNDVSTRNDTLFFLTSKSPVYGGYVATLRLAPNRQPNPTLIVLLVSELLLLITFWSVHAFIMAPIASGDKGYIVLWSLFKRVYFWRLLGKASIYRLPRYVAFDKRYFSSTVGHLSSEFRQVFQRRLLLLDFCVYELGKVDELAVVQHIAHELKNRLHVMQLMLDDDSPESRAELKKSLNWCFRASRTICDFSRVHALALASVDLRDILEDTAHSLMGYPAFERLRLETPATPVVALVDRKLLGMALRNLLENALQATESEGEVVAALSACSGQATLTVRNPGYIPPDALERILTDGGWGDKPDGAGVGVGVARVIVENHDGRFHLACADGEVTATIILNQT